MFTAALCVVVQIESLNVQQKEKGCTLYIKNGALYRIYMKEL